MHAFAQSILLVAQEVDVSKWSSAIVSALVGFAIIVTMREALKRLDERVREIGTKVDQIAADHTKTQITVARISAHVEATGDTTGRFPRGGE